jgi:15-cis-phytoene synthase
MTSQAHESPLSAPELLAIAYAPKNVREKFRWLLLFGHRVNETLVRAREPMIAQMRLAWWRDVLAKPAANRPKGEPLLAIMADDPILVRAALELVDATELLVGDPDEAVLAQSALARASGIFGAYATWVESERRLAEKLAEAYAGGNNDVITSVPRALRPLSILTLSAQLERQVVKPGPLGPGIRLSWHALTGR